MPEVKILPKLNHPNILKVYDVWVEKGRKICLLSDYYEKDVSKLIDCSDVSLNKDDIKIIAHDILQGIKYLHKNKIIHWDIKPSNVLINK